MATRLETDDLALLARLLGRSSPDPAALAAAWHRSGRGAALLGLPAAELRERLDLPPGPARRLEAALELGRRAVAGAGELPEPIRGGGDVFRYLAPRFAGLRVECFRALYLDAKGRLLSEEEISQGTLTASLVHPREVFGPALVHRAAALVVAHNHPSGDPEPSAEDRATTRRLVRAGRLLGVELLDHLVCGRGRYVSFLEQGWL